MDRTYCDLMYEDFRARCAWIKDSDILDWYQVGRNELVTVLIDGSRIYFNDITKYMRIVKRYDDRDDGCLSEGDWRREFSMRLQRRIQEMGITQKELSERSGVTQGVISNAINERTTLTTYNLTKLARALGCSVAELTEFD